MPAGSTASIAVVGALLPAAFAIPAIYFVQELHLLMWIALIILIGIFGAAVEDVRASRSCRTGKCRYTPKSAYISIALAAVLSLWLVYELIGVFACVPWSNNYWICD